MTDEIKLQMESARGQQAKRIIEDPMVQEALDLIKDNIRHRWEASKVEDVESREKAWHMLHIANEFQRFFLQAMQTGQLAEKQLSMMQKVQQKVSNIWR